MTYRLIASSETDPNSPVTSTLMIALDANLAATAAGETGAPKIALKSSIGTLVTSGNLTFSGLSAWSGVWFKLEGYNSSGSAARTITFNATAGGYLGAVTIVSVAISSRVTLTGFFDFATGLVHGVWGQGTNSVSTFSQTIAGASLNITAIRFTSAANIAGGVMIHPNGGESAT